jgi:predicted phage terminase large subunit-like protein
LVDDQNAKTRFENDATGYRIATAVGAAATGEGGDVVVVDDPHSAQGAASQTQREGTLIWWDETMSTRLNDPKTGRKVIVMQRLHERDLAGHVLEQGGYEHLCLPMEYEPERHCATSIGWEDPRTEAGEPLWPERIGPEEIASKRRELGEYGYVGQFQQRPAPRGGGMFPVDRFNILQHRPQPKDIAASVRYIDKAGTHQGGAWTVGVLMHRMKDGTYVVADVMRGQWSALERDRRIRQTAEMDGYTVRVFVEQEPGSGGKESAENTIRQLAGYRVQADRVTGDKETRADPYAAQVQGGNVYLVQGAWNHAFIAEHETFPVGQYKDQVDAAAGAFAKLSGRGAGMEGLTTW